MGYYYSIAPATVKEERGYMRIVSVEYEVFNGKRPHEFWESHPKDGWYTETGEDGPVEGACRLVRIKSGKQVESLPIQVFFGPRATGVRP